MSKWKECNIEVKVECPKCKKWSKLNIPKGKLPNEFMDKAFIVCECGNSIY